MAGSNGIGIVASLFIGNNAQSGGAMYAGPGARGLVAYTNFDSNTAKSYGGALLVDDDSQIQISNSAFTNNGRYSCYDPPMVCPIDSSVWLIVTHHLQEKHTHMKQIFQI